MAILDGLVLQSRLQRSLQGRQLTAKRAAWVISTSTFALTLAGGAGAWLVDRKDFDGLGDALWWAMQTVTTVGYGDVVPENVAGRLIGVVLMLQGIALLTVITASVTATLIDQARRRGRSPRRALGRRLLRVLWRVFWRAFSGLRRLALGLDLGLAAFFLGAASSMEPRHFGEPQRQA